MLGLPGLSKFYRLWTENRTSNETRRAQPTYNVLDDHVQPTTSGTLDRPIYTEPLYKGTCGEFWDIISFPRNIFRSLEILFRSLEIYFVPSKYYFVPSKYISFLRNTFRSLEISIVPSKLYTSSRRNPHRFHIKTCQQTGRNRPPKCRRIKEEIVNIFTGGGGSQSVAITRTICRIWHAIYRVWGI